MRIEELMTRCPAVCGPDETLSQAAQKMEGANCAFLPVTAGAGSRRLVGVITDGDISMAARLGGTSLGKLRVRDAMAREVRVCNPGDSLFEAEEIMQKAGIRHLPVVDEFGRLLGAVSLTAVTHEAERESEALSARITAAQFGLVVPEIRKPYRVGTPAKAEDPVHPAESDTERRAAVA